MPRPTCFNKPGVVYGLVDPITLKVMYIGQTVRTLEARLHDHLSKPGLLGDTPKKEWLKGLIAKGLKPNVIILEEATGWKLVDAEKKWIDIFESQTKALTNRSVTKEYKETLVKKQPVVKPLKGYISGKRLLQMEREKEAVKSLLAS